ncbi:23S rRNA (guanine745-N1)-methyltransferase [Weissella uvarum]|uniref:methyltransferase domain-containing protein n=1 Tax=Weissella uvarum TaxID=1479233 RepID=UPI00195FFF9F|nr:methyltransferase domain-containing protein [Weissella uvarum]MBM7616809.1 23S rRNA (guanine745-N1)-methyltransferase [Weissella uvarum]MCM0594739.1 methyltransferase domain-containing protein [Weissella uvarum]
MKKIDRGTAFVQQHLSLFQCPTCRAAYTEVDGHSLVCPNHHTLDVNKKGSLNFLNRNVDTEYDDAMLASRRKVLSAGLFDGIVTAVGTALDAQAQTILDVGTGEGTPLAKLLAERNNQDVGLGFDISKAGINLATQLDTDAFYLVADLAHLPFMDHQIDTIVEFFSPSAYEEFNRVLKPGGRLVKVIPNAGYLHELREMLYPVDSKNHTYSNDKVLNHFMATYPQATQQRVQYTWTIPADIYVDLLHMTPLHWGARPEAQALAEQTPLDQVTVDVTVLVVDV